MISKIRSSKFTKIIALFICISILNTTIGNTELWALTSGPTQPEFTSFEPISTTDMVDLFTGDFNYNIPLFEIPGPNGGYPFNLAYHAGVGMEEEASWVGLGWNVNAGAINRSMRNIPDEFNGEDSIIVNKDMKSDWTFGVGAGGTIEGIGIEGLGLSGNLGIRYNSYKGLGYNISFGINYEIEGIKIANSGIEGKVGLNLNLDSDDGVDASPSYGIKVSQAKNSNGFNTFGLNGSCGFNSRTGITGSNWGYSIENSKARAVTNVINTGQGLLSNGGISKLSFAQTSFSPSIQDANTGDSYRVNFKMGASWLIYGNFEENGFYTTQKLLNKGKDVIYPAIGYLYLNKEIIQNYTDSIHEIATLIDFAREKDGLIRKTSPNLSIPSHTYDIFSVVGQGIGNMFRPYRSDFGIVHDQEITSTTSGLSYGVEYGTPTNVGANGGFTTTYSKSSEWNIDKHDDDEDDMIIKSTFNYPDRNQILEDQPDYEEYWFQTFGEQTADELPSELDYSYYIEEPVAIGIENSKGNFIGTNKMLDKKFRNVYEGQKNRKHRKNRGVGIISFKNCEILNDSNEIIIPEFIIDNEVDRSKDHHIAGYIGTNNQGVRYVYALPTKNLKQTDYVFSVESAKELAKLDINYLIEDGNPVGINYKVGEGMNPEYYESKTIPEYANSYLLTSILGNDYVDVTGNGVSEDDLGYWVKFSYNELTEEKPFFWRAPYLGANAIDGFKSIEYDDKGAYLFGSKEVFYLSKVETSTHLAEFFTSDRIDGRSSIDGGFVNHQTEINFQNETMALQKLDSICLYSKQEYATNSNPVAIKTIHFRYAQYGTNTDPELCKNLPNTSIEGRGKLTLSEMFFTYKHNNRGKLNPYHFDYGAEIASNNPNYNQFAIDRWGNYKPIEDNEYWNSQEPFTDQSNTQNTNSSVWNLKKISLPSGGEISVDYESDTYAYVQDKPAMRFFKIASVESNCSLNPETNCILNNDDRKIFFELENQGSINNLTEATNEARKYISTSDQLLFKLYMKLGKSSSSYGSWETVTGYADIDEISAIYSSSKWYGSLKLKPQVIGKSNPKSYNPFMFAGYQFIRTNRPDFDDSEDIMQNYINLENQSLENTLISISLVFEKLNEGIEALFYSPNEYYKNENWCKRIDLNHSFIRLNEIDKVKYGGGCRVKQVKISDNWNQFSGESNAAYGQKYDYTTIENGKKISSGVASYEPVVGGEENPFKQAKKFVENIPYKTDNSLFWEGPINENLMPAPSVGYSMVTVASLTTDEILKKAIHTQGTGIQIHEFYTAKDFPVIVDETKLVQDKSMLQSHQSFGTTPFYEKTIDQLAASQGYLIILNDMHGKPKKTSSYGLKLDEANNWIIDPSSLINSQETLYYRKNNLTNNGPLYNQVDVMLKPIKTDKPPKIKNMEMGVDYEFIIDTRFSETQTDFTSVALNGEIIFTIPLIYPIPNIRRTISSIKLATTNKIIHKSGIIRKIVTTNGPLKVEQENLLFDPSTGSPILTRTTNEYNQNVFSYNLPAYHIYDKMGKVSENIGISFKGNLSSFGSDIELTPSSSTTFKYLKEGDKILVSFSDDFTGEKALIQILEKRKIGNNYEILCRKLGVNPQNTSLFTSSNELSFKIIQSGNANILSEIAESIVSLDDPSKLTTDTCMVYDTKFLQTAGSNETIETCDTSCGNAYTNILFDIFNNDTSLYDTIISGLCRWMLADSLPAAGFLLGGNYFPNAIWLKMISENPIVEIGMTPDPNKLYLGAGSTNYFHVCDSIWLVNPVTNNQVSLSNISSITSTEVVPGSLIGSQYNDECVLLINYTLEGSSTINTAILSLPASCVIDSSIATEPSYMWISTPTPKKFAKLDNVLNYSAKRYSEVWYNNLNDQNFYASGQAGNWHVLSDYVYNTSRTSVDISTMNKNINKKQSGLMNNVVRFDWDKNITELITDCAPGRWVEASKNLKLNSQSEIAESKDALDIYSSALFGFGSKFMTATAKNAKLYEIGYSGFEDSYVNHIYDQGEYLESNFDFYKYGSSYSLWENYPVSVGKGNQVILNTCFPVLGTEAKVHAIAYAEDNLPYEEVKNMSFLSNNTVSFIASPPKIDHNFQKSILLSNPPDFVQSAETRQWVGDLSIKRTISASTDNLNFFIDSLHSHSGSNSMKIAGLARFFQYKLKAEYDKDYLMSFWIHIPDYKTYTYKNSGFSSKIRYYNSGNSELTQYQTSNDCIVFVGEIIDGWQKVELKFTTPSISSYSSQNYTHFSIEFNSGTNACVYIDDIRFLPFSAQMKSYVYDPIDYKLHAELDENNYSTFYYYNSAGNLFLIKKETEKGIKTIQENKTHYANE